MHALFAPLLTLWTLQAVGGRSPAADSAGFVTVLGRDTIALESFSRTASRLQGEIVLRVPGTVHFHYAIDLNPDGTVSHSVVDLRPLAAPNIPGRRVTLDYIKDSVRVAVDSGGSTRRDTRPGFQITDSIEVPFVGALNARVGTKRFQRRSLSLIDVDFFGIAWTHLTTDSGGRILAADGNGTTEQIKTHRTGPLDVCGAAKRFADRDRAGKGIGIASPSDSVVVTLGPAHLRIDYSSPRRRGRTILGTVVPYDQVWRTGANAATTFFFDRAMTVGTTVVPVGGYSVWTRPTATGVELILNKQTGQWGTEYNPARDFAHIPMQVSTESNPRENFTIGISAQGSNGELRILWDTFVWRVAVKVN